MPKKRQPLLIKVSEFEEEGMIKKFGGYFLPNIFALNKVLQRQTNKFKQARQPRRLFRDWKS